MEQENLTIYIDSDLEDLIPEFLENKLHEIEIIRDFLKNDDFENISKMAHKIKGSGGGYGFNKMSEIANTIEIFSKGQNKKDLETSLDELMNYINNVNIVYKEMW